MIRKAKIVTFLGLGLLVASVIPFGALIVKWKSSRHSTISHGDDYVRCASALQARKLVHLLPSLE